MKVNNYPLKTPSAGDKLFGSDSNGDQKQFDVSNFGATTYKVYTALLNQTSGPSAPTVSVIENTIGPLVWTRVSDGVYQATLTNAFVDFDKLFLNISNNLQNLGGINYITVWDGSTIQVDTLDSNSSHSDGLLDSTAIEIRVYN